MRRLISRTKWFAITIYIHARRHACTYTHTPYLHLTNCPNKFVDKLQRGKTHNSCIFMTHIIRYLHLRWKRDLNSERPRLLHQFPFTIARSDNNSASQRQYSASFICLLPRDTGTVRENDRWNVDWSWYMFLFSRTNNTDISNEYGQRKQPGDTQGNNTISWDHS